MGRASCWAYLYVVVLMLQLTHSSVFIGWIAFEVPFSCIGMYLPVMHPLGKNSSRASIPKSSIRVSRQITVPSYSTTERARFVYLESTVLEFGTDAFPVAFCALVLIQSTPALETSSASPTYRFVAGLQISVCRPGRRSRRTAAGERAGAQELA